LAHRFKYHGEVSRTEKIALLQSFDVLSVPTVYRESKGLFALEALANAVPLVLPRHGAFPELVADTGGGPVPLAAGDAPPTLLLAARLIAPFHKFTWRYRPAAIEDSSRSC
jgi:glycosyltransferase involved in cell wall biosynthesis